MKVIEIGDWDMDTTSSLNIAHGFNDRNQILSVIFVIRNDADSQSFTVHYNQSVGGDSQRVLNISTITNIEIDISRITGSTFDSVNFNSTSYNRGWIYISYKI